MGLLAERDLMVSGGFNPRKNYPDTFFAIISTT